MPASAKENFAIEDLRRAEFFYNNILSNLPTNVYWKDKNCVYMGCNDRLAKVMGLASRDAIKGMTDFDFDWGIAGAAEQFVEFDKKVMRTRQSLTTEDTFAEADGNVVIVLTNKTPLVSENGKVIGVLAISVDITERKKAEQALKEEKERAEAALKAKEVAEAESREKSLILQDVLKEIKAKKYFLTGEYEDIYLTKRQAECAYCLANGKTVKETGKLFDLATIL
jgi:PAS domain S-box-containing protein